MATSGWALHTPTAAPAPQSKRLSASSMRRSAPVLAPSAARVANSPSRRTVRVRIRLATLEHAMMNTSADAASSTSSQTAKYLSHAMNAVRVHGCREVVRAGDHVGDDFGILRIRYGGFEDAD